MENSTAVPHNVKCGVTIWSTNFTPKYPSKKNENICPHKDLYTNVHNSTVHNRGNEGKNQMAINGWMNKYGQVTLEYYSPKKKEKKYCYMLWR